MAGELKTANQAFLINILERGLNDFKIERALKQYSRGNMSFGAAAEQANVSQSMLSKYAYARGIEPSFSVETVDEYLLILINSLDSLSKTSQFVIPTIGGILINQALKVSPIVERMTMIADQFSTTDLLRSAPLLRLRNKRIFLLFLMNN